MKNVQNLDVRQQKKAHNLISIRKKNFKIIN